MARSSISLPESALPFGADTHNHNAYRRSNTALGGLDDDQAQHPQQDYSSFLAAAQAEDTRSHRASASIPPSSVKSLPLGHRALLRRRKVLIWIVSVVFEISLIALTAGIVLCAVRAHEYNADGGGKAAFVIVGVFGFAGMVGSAAVGWLVWQGRNERAGLEKKWAADEEIKEWRSVRETSRANEVLRSIKERERSLSRSRSRSRGRASHRPPPAATRLERPYTELIPSYREMTPTATEAPSVVTEQARESDWTNHLDLSTSEDEEYRSSQQVTNERLEQEIFEHMSRPTTPGTPRPGSLSITGVMLGSSPTLLNPSSSPAEGPVARPQRQQDSSHNFASSPQSPTLFDFANIDGPPPSPPPKSVLPALPTAPSSPVPGRLHQQPVPSRKYGPSPPPSPPPKSPLPALPSARSSPVTGRSRQQPVTPGLYGPSPSTQHTSLLNFSPIIDPAGGIHPAYRTSGPFDLSPDLQSNRLDLNEGATTSPPISSPLPSISEFPKPPTSGFPHQQPSDPASHESSSSPQSPTLLNSSPVTGSIGNATHHATRNPPLHSHPIDTRNSPQNSNTGTGTGTGTNTASTLLNSSSNPNDNPTSPRAPLPISTPPPSNPPPTTATTTTRPPTLASNPTLPLRSPPQRTNSHPHTTIIRASNGGLGAAQSDENFLAMLDASSDANSEDEARLAVRRVQSQERVRAWASEANLAGSPHPRGMAGVARAPYLTGREEDAGGMVRRGWMRGLRRFSLKSSKLGGGI